MTLEVPQGLKKIEPKKVIMPNDIAFALDLNFNTKDTSKLLNAFDFIVHTLREFATVPHGCDLPLETIKGIVLTNALKRVEFGKSNPQVPLLLEATCLVDLLPKK